MTKYLDFVAADGQVVLRLPLAMTVHEYARAERRMKARQRRQSSREAWAAIECARKRAQASAGTEAPATPLALVLIAPLAGAQGVRHEHPEVAQGRQAGRDRVLAQLADELARLANAAALEFSAPPWPGVFHGPTH